MYSMGVRKASSDSHNPSVALTLNLSLPFSYSIGIRVINSFFIPGVTEGDILALPITALVDPLIACCGKKNEESVVT